MSLLTRYGTRLEGLEKMKLDTNGLPLPGRELWGECYYCQHEWRVMRKVDKLSCPNCGETLISWFFVDRQEENNDCFIG
jgi:predicted RNA-binding Zn-ribbon protein involved in translation (DUF1610 family)